MEMAITNEKTRILPVLFVWLEFEASYMWWDIGRIPTCPVGLVEAAETAKRANQTFFTPWAELCVKGKIQFFTRLQEQPDLVFWMNTGVGGGEQNSCGVWIV